MMSAPGLRPGTEAVHANGAGATAADAELCQLTAGAVAVDLANVQQKTRVPQSDSIPTTGRIFNPLRLSD
ncbi:hypothetical protein M4D79_05875 [Mycolicibacterium novocastrense]|nr:hypothetical protein M4D79_05875 [Mycolicibacterium novocastrense]